MVKVTEMCDRNQQLTLHYFPPITSRTVYAYKTSTCLRCLYVAFCFVTLIIHCVQTNSKGPPICFRHYGYMSTTCSRTSSVNVIHGVLYQTAVGAETLPNLVTTSDRHRPEISEESRQRDGFGSVTQNIEWFPNFTTNHGMMEWFPNLCLPPSVVNRYHFSARCVRRTDRRAIATMFVSLSVCLGWACIVIIRCTLARI